MNSRVNWPRLRSRLPIYLSMFFLLFDRKGELYGYEGWEVETVGRLMLYMVITVLVIKIWTLRPLAVVLGFGSILTPYLAMDGLRALSTGSTPVTVLGLLLMTTLPVWCVLLYKAKEVPY